jgi:Calcium-activated chloride channel
LEFRTHFEGDEISPREEVERTFYCSPSGDKDGNCFTHSIKLQILFDLLQSDEKGGCDLPILDLLHDDKIAALFPLHEKHVQDQLLASEADPFKMPWAQDIDGLRDYLGEKVALNHLFIGHYSLYLVAPSIVGFVFQIVVWATKDPLDVVDAGPNYSHPVLPFFAVLICIWSVVTLEHWGDIQNHTALKWGTAGAEKREQDRPTYVGEKIRSFINGEEMTYFNPNVKGARIFWSFSLIGSFILLVIGAVAAIYYMRFALQPKIGSNASICTYVYIYIYINA